MAQIISEGFRDQFNAAVDLGMERLAHLESMEDKFAKAWILELIDHSAMHNDEMIKAYRALGSTCFNPAML